MNTGLAVRKLRQSKGLSLGQLSKAINCDKPYLSRLERNEYCLSKSKYLDAICDYFGVPLPIIFLMSLEVGDAPIDKREEARIVLGSISSTYFDIFSKPKGESMADKDSSRNKSKI